MAAIILVAGGTAYWQYKVNTRLHEQVATLQIENKLQKETITQVSNNYNETVKRIDFIQQQSDIINSNAQAKVEVFNKHNLALLAEKKAGLIEIRVNSGSQKALDALENLTDPQWKP